MQAKYILKICLLLCLLASLLAACNAIPSVSSNGTPATSSTPDDAHTPNVWHKTSSGVEVRYELWKGPSGNEDNITIVRLNPKRVRLSVGYQPDAPMPINAWMKQTGARVLINGGYFNEKNRPTGLLISNGETVGSSYDGFGGMLAVSDTGTISIRSLRNQPYDPNEQIQQATQSSPMMMINGKRTEFQANAANQRRTVAAMDKQGNLLFIVSPSQAFSLDEFADLLASSDLAIQTALNLDGGSSTGLYVDSQTQNVAIDSLAALPIVIIVK